MLPAVRAATIAAMAVLLASCGEEDAAQAPASAEAVLAVTPDDMILGSPDAPVTIVEYASLTCPHCAQFDLETLPKLRQQYIDAGKVNLVFRDFPLDTWALRASMLAHCAGKERFFGFIDVLFSNQPQWSRAPDPGAALAGIAKIGGIGQDEFESCMNNDALSAKITKTRFDAEQALEIQSTPTFFVNGQKLVGAQPFEAFEAAIVEALPNP